MTPTVWAVTFGGICFLAALVISVWGVCARAHDLSGEPESIRAWLGIDEGEEL